LLSLTYAKRVQSYIYVYIYIYEIESDIYIYIYYIYIYEIESDIYIYIYMHAQVRGRDGWTCFHHALSLPSRGSDVEAWIRAAAALPSGAALLAEAEKDVAALAADGGQLEAAGGAGDGVQVRRGWRAGGSSGIWHASKHTCGWRGRAGG
jgi:hypothetical protein